MIRMKDEAGIGTYKVGLFSDLERLFQRISYGPEHWKRKPVRAFLRLYRASWRNPNYWSGYLAEWHYPPDNVLHYHCGHGWTRRRAIRNLGIHLAYSNLSEEERTR